MTLEGIVGTSKTLSKRSKSERAERLRLCLLECENITSNLFTKATLDKMAELCPVASMSFMSDKRTGSKAEKVFQYQSEFVWS